LLIAVATAAQLAGSQKAELQALKQYVQIAPSSTDFTSIEKRCHQLGGSCKPQSK
jgi:hypothetical protein